MKSRTGAVLLGVIVMSAGGAPLRAQNQTASPAASAPALLAPGTPAPSATVLVNGRPAPLKGILAGNRNLVLFYPVACSSCDAELQALNKSAIQSLAQTGVAVFALSPDAPAAIAATSARLSLPFSVFSDPQGAAANAFHVASSAAFLIDGGGTVRAVFDLSQQPLSSSAVLAAAQALKRPSSR